MAVKRRYVSCSRRAEMSGLVMLEALDSNICIASSMAGSVNVSYCVYTAFFLSIQNPEREGKREHQEGELALFQPCNQLLEVILSKLAGVFFSWDGLWLTACKTKLGSIRSYFHIFQYCTDYSSLSIMLNWESEITISCPSHSA